MTTSKFSFAEGEPQRLNSSVLQNLRGRVIQLGVPSPRDILSVRHLQTKSVTGYVYHPNISVRIHDISEEYEQSRLVSGRSSLQKGEPLLLYLTFEILYS